MRLSSESARDTTEAGCIEGVWCPSANRLARVYAYQVIILNESARHGVSVLFDSGPESNTTRRRSRAVSYGVLVRVESSAKYRCTVSDHIGIVVDVDGKVKLDKSPADALWLPTQRTGGR